MQICVIVDVQQLLDEVGSTVSDHRPNNPPFSNCAEHTPDCTAATRLSTFSYYAQRSV